MIVRGWARGEHSGAYTCARALFIWTHYDSGFTVEFRLKICKPLVKHRAEKPPGHEDLM